MTKDRIEQIKKHLNNLYLQYSACNAMHGKISSYSEVPSIRKNLKNIQKQIDYNKKELDRLIKKMEMKDD